MARKRRRKARGPKQAASAPAVPADDLNAASRAQLGRDEGERRYRPPPEDASIEDPLQDWPEDA